MEPILNFDLSSEAYHAETECASNSNLSLLKRSPIHMKWAQANPVESPAMRLGTLVHLIGELAQHRAVVGEAGAVAVLVPDQTVGVHDRGAWCGLCVEA